LSAFVCELDSSSKIITPDSKYIKMFNFYIHQKFDISNLNYGLDTSNFQFIKNEIFSYSYKRIYKKKCFIMLNSQFKEVALFQPIDVIG
jgi:hypothetical protein